MRSLQVKFGALIVTLLVIACLALAWLSTEHERRGLELEVEYRARALASYLAGSVKDSLVAKDDLTVRSLANKLGNEPGVATARVLDANGRVLADSALEHRARELARELATLVAEPLRAQDLEAVENLVDRLGVEPEVAMVRVLDSEGRVVAVLSDGEADEVRDGLAPDRGQETPQDLVLRQGTAEIRSEDAVLGEVRVQLVAQEGPFGASTSELSVTRQGSQLAVAVPIHYRDPLQVAGEAPPANRVGEAQIVLDLEVLVAQRVRQGRQQLAIVAVVVAVLGVVAGLLFVSLLVGPIRRLRAGVECLSRGDLAVRVPPTTRDEIGDLTEAFNAMGESLQQKERIQNAFGRYVSDYVVTQLLENESGTDLTGVEREVTILFADIRRFTRLSEGMKARDVVALLNEYFECVAGLILSHGGTIDKFIGDSVMAYFGAPVPQTDHAARAVKAAIAIQRALSERSVAIGTSDPESFPVAVGIGIHTGVVVVGNIGSERRSDFTAIGDAVNVASRLEKLAGHGEILVSEAVQRCVRGSFPLRFEGERQLSGRLEPVNVYAVDLGDTLPDALGSAASGAGSA